MQCKRVQLKKSVTREIFTDLVPKITILSTLPYPSINRTMAMERSAEKHQVISELVLLVSDPCFFNAENVGIQSHNHPTRKIS
jgi:hypothetical protein